MQEQLITRLETIQASIIGRSLLPDETFITAKFWAGDQNP